MTKLTIKKLIAVFKGFTLVELNESVKTFEEGFNATAAAPAVVVAAAPATGEEATAIEEEKDLSDVVLETAGDKGVAVIKEIRALTSLGLKEAKGLVDSAPKAALEGVDKEAASKAKKRLEGADASVTVK